MPKEFEKDPDYKRGEGTYEAKLKDQNIPQSAWGEVGDSVNPNEFKRIVTGFKSTGDPYSGDNVAQSSLSPVDAPDQSDPLKIREGIQTELGIQDLKSEVAGIEENLGKFDVETRALGQDISGRQVSMSKITGITDQAMRQRALGRVAIAEELEAKANLLGSAMEESQFRFGIAMDQRSQMQQLMLKAPGSGIKFGDSFESAVGKLDSWQQDQEEEAREQAKKDSLDSLYMNTFGTDRGKMSRREAQKKLSKRFGSDRAYQDRIKAISEESANLSLQSSRTKYNALKKSLETPKEATTAGYYGDEEQTSSASGGGSEDGGGDYSRYYPK